MEQDDGSWPDLQWILNSKFNTSLGSVYLKSKIFMPKMIIFTSKFIKMSII